MYTCVYNTHMFVYTHIHLYLDLHLQVRVQTKTESHQRHLPRLVKGFDLFSYRGLISWNRFLGSFIV